ncbi:MAG: SUMF1/EgtB/PvdO family nonheme iron enzyme [Myxococcota bacterium]
MTPSSAPITVACTLALLILTVSCAEAPPPSEDAPPPPAAPVAPKVIAPRTAVPAPATPVCPPDMVLAAGRYCPEVRHRCLEHHPDYARETRRRERARARGEDPGPRRAVEICLRYAPGTCVDETRRRPLRFCIDRHEYPGQAGALPALLITWRRARALCADADKRLCTSDEFNFACEGEAMLPYSYGLERDPRRCLQDRPYIAPERPLLPYAECQERAWCRSALAALDQRAPIGARPRCTSPFGAFDLNGSVNEWVMRPGKTAPWRSGLKGGWWGPARSRCRPMVTAHDENYSGYEVGFRCCRDATPSNPG